MSEGKSQQVIGTDQLKDTAVLSAVSRALLEAKEEILTAWEKKVRAEVRRATDLPHPILIDTIPAYLESIAESISPDYPRTIPPQLTTACQEHGGERARLTEYDPSDVIQEYQILREAIFSTCRNRGIVFSISEATTIHTSIDMAMRDAVTAFALVQANIREQYIATLTHDVRNPLGVIHMAVDLALGSLDNEKELAILLSKALENTKRADSMIRDLLDATLIKSGGRLRLEIEECDILTIVKEAVSALSLAHGNRFKVMGQSFHGYWSAKEMRRAIENLAANAVKYGDSRAPITIAIRAEHERVLISVHNEGEPVPIEEQEAIFQAFRRSLGGQHREKKGWGLGLALVRGVAESHGGSVFVDSAPGRGTTFSIDVPTDCRPYQNAPILR